MPKPGDILFHKDFTFADGSKGEKLFIILNNVAGNDPYLVLMTTSQSKRYPKVTQGCNPSKKVFFAPIKWQTCFRVDTYIQLPKIEEFTATEVLIGGMKTKTIEVLRSPISDDCLAQLRNCLKQFKEDISENHWKLIFSK